MTTPIDGFHFALSTRLAHLDQLAGALEPLERDTPPIRRVQLRFSASVQTLVALVAFDDARCATLQHGFLRSLCARFEAQCFDLETIDDAGRAELLRFVERHPLRTQADLTVSVVASLRAVLIAPLLRLDFDDLDQLYASWARNVTEGGLFVPATRVAHAELFRVDFQVAGQTFEGSTAGLIQRAPVSADRPGFWLELAPSDELQGLFERRARERHQGRPSEDPPPGIIRQAPRFDTMLEVRFDDPAKLEPDWATDISHGGMFIATDNPPDLRERINVRLALPQGELTLGAEVVHRIISGSRPGVGVQFLPDQEEALAPMFHLIEDYQRRQPRVLVVDDEAIWRSTLARALAGIGCDVQLATDGREGLLKLIEGFFDLDLVILDLHMPNLDGKGLIERVRRSGGERNLKMFLFSAAPPEELAAVAETGLATGVFSKLDNIDTLTARIAQELGLGLPGQPRRKAA